MTSDLPRTAQLVLGSHQACDTHRSTSMDPAIADTNFRTHAKTVTVSKSCGAIPENIGRVDF